jgi:hypothetical protein
MSQLYNDYDIFRSHILGEEWPFSFSLEKMPRFVNELNYKK